MVKHDHDEEIRRLLNEIEETDEEKEVLKRKHKRDGDDELDEALEEE